MTSIVNMPFGICAESGAWVDVGDALNGKACNCICPSCEQSLLARQGPKTSWHFGHDGSADKAAVTECDISFFSCCRSFAIENFSSVILECVVLPTYLVEVGVQYGIDVATRTSEVTQSSELKSVLLTHVPESSYDFETKIGKFTLAFHLAYSGRTIPEVKSPSTTGLIALDLCWVQEQYARSRGGQVGMMKRFLLQLFSCVDGKVWLHHPNEEAAREHCRINLLAELNRYTPHSSPAVVRSAVKIPSKETVEEKRKQRLAVSVQRAIDNTLHHCARCDMSWFGDKTLDAECLKCESSEFK